MSGRLVALVVGCVLAVNAVAGQQAAIEQRLGTGTGARPGVGLNLKSTSALVLDQSGQRILYAKNVEWVVPIASITKLMTALVVLDSGLPLDEPIKISKDDRDGLKGTRSRLTVGMSVSREDLLRIALMASENRAAAALSRAYPGGTDAFVAAMNRKAAELGMWRSRFVDGTGLSSGNVSNAQDLARLVGAAYRHPLIREYTTDSEYTVRLANGRKMQFTNSNRLVRNSGWDIGLSKTGYISEAGRCLVMQAHIAATPVIIVLLDSWGHLTRIGDANRIKKWMESNSSRQPAAYTLAGTGDR
ncbi:MAG TPA: D-alanyl-D-alanine endopeptidase [Burkholderiales bacterium]|nr:D-alanyl-D-alanine endopeptidase [Burkholderiales bacterium]